nr:chloride channel protein [Roseovarius spongiae]
MWRVLLTRGPSKFQFWLIALGIGVMAGFLTVLFRKSLEALERFSYGADDGTRLHSYVQTLDWWWILAVPIMGGVIIGQILHHFTPDARARAVAEVIEGAAVNEGRMEHRAGVASIAASLVTLGMGGSGGREGPVVHMAGVLASWVSSRIDADGITGRNLLGCAVAAAVSASFNAPIAGALFAMEVVLRHFAVQAFAPIVIASVAGAVVSRFYFGDITEFIVPGSGVLAFYGELPAYLLLGVVSGMVAAIYMYSIFFAEDTAGAAMKRLGFPRWLRPVIAGALLGGMAIWYPHIIGVGYETTSAALTGKLVLHEAVVFAVLKVAAVAITMGGMMGGGMFSPSLMVGALTGLAFGLIATGFFPEVSGSATLYALAGMGAVAGAVLGAPISTTLIVFELTGDWQTGIAVMISVSISTALSARFVARSYFLTQLERRGVRLAAGPQSYLLSMNRVSLLMRKPDHAKGAPKETCWEMIDDGIYIDATATLEVAMPIFDRTGVLFIPVVTLGKQGEEPELLGALFHVDALQAFNRALSAISKEEHS